MLKSVIDKYNIPKDRVDAIEIKPFELFAVEGYKITPIKAEHGVKAAPVIYAVEKDGKAFCMLTIRASFARRAWNAYEASKSLLI